tara:strand:- start:133 stop:423 length:291 start_codon:yes stop_codon:yes gene_type:complete
MAKKTTKTEIKFTQEELDSLQSLRESATRVESDLGRLEIARINVEQRLQGIDNQKIELETRYLELQKQEVSIASDLNEKYGAGNLNPETGVFTPTK